jgi:hypothetical protein
MKKIITAPLFFLLLSASHLSSSAQPPLNAPPTCKNTAHAPGIRLTLKGIYVLDGLLWFVATVTNTSPIDWRSVPMRFSISDRHVWRRRARQQFSLPIIARREPLLVPSDSAATLCYALAPRLPAKRQHLLLEYSERTGDRTLTLRLTEKQLLKAKKLESLSNGNVHPTAQPTTPAVTNR